jgi:hypothetical protein
MIARSIRWPIVARLTSPSLEPLASPFRRIISKIGGYSLASISRSGGLFRFR